jgi:exodeoxyribonuclease VII large subunit
MSVTNILTVSTLTELIKISIKTDIPKGLCVTGEISNFKISKNNIYFTLKDNESSINVAMWNHAPKIIKLDVADGKMVKLWGNLVIFGKSGSYNLNAYKLELLGTGNLFLEYEKIKEHYSKLGYFNDDIKKPLPNVINKIGVATAFGGAALQDFLYIIKKNSFIGTVYIKNCVVQGKDCPVSVASAIQELDTMNLDVIIITRGGGGYEDLCEFSNSKIIEALHNCKTCTVSAIGHEIDFMLSDFVADIRAPTPSIAGQMVSSKKESAIDVTQIVDLVNRIDSMIYTKLAFMEYDLIGIANTLKSPLEIINKQLNDMDIIQNKLMNNIRMKINNIESELNTISRINNPNVILSKGYCAIYSMDDKQICCLEEFNGEMAKKKKLKIKFIDGNVLIDVRNIKND